jgi:hypothetical protein
MHILKQSAVLAVTFGSLISAAAAAPVTTSCGAPVSSIVKTVIDQFSTPSEFPVILVGTGVNITVPAGETRCVRVRFSAVAECPHNCFLRAFANNTELNPAWFSSSLRFSSDSINNGTAHSFDWAGRVGQGQQTIFIKVQTGNSMDNARFGPFTTTVEIAR